MDLANYKKAWENQPEEKNKVSTIEIYKMTQAKSTSIVKWIFIIGLMEFIFLSALSYFFFKLGYLEIYETLDLMKYLNFTYYLNYVVIILFLALFYKNYSSVSVIDNTKTLMRKIIRVRKTVKFYVYINMIFALGSMVIFNILIINTPGGIETILANENIKATESELMTAYIVSQVIALIIILVILSLYYYLLYGLMLKKLNKNYKELNKLEEIN